MTTEVLDYGYAVVAISKPLTASQHAAVGASGTDFATATYTAKAGATEAHIDIGSTEIDVFDLKDQCEFIRMTETAGNQRLTTVAAKAVRELATRASFEVNAAFIADDDDDGVKGVIVNDRTGHRLLYVETTESQKWCGEFDIHMVDHREQRDDTGVIVYDVTLRNFGNAPPKRF